ncbi:DUF2384 domain-containing protein [Pseudomonas gregormendelii]|uniref:DUF2384 domain-containing protein n=1 Tax=Pseudomonas gregormendelii TaxID=1628277 RepID=A0ABS3AQE4_9PSED|nr:antitoxin Xre/MbcA/ParS toxin-binding domain-containing protein [Pseudomonas gregormendelii]MBN3968461.1 DUF2384 domain-containing protein [Pseudomonas gregormendelii]
MPDRIGDAAKGRQPSKGFFEALALASDPTASAHLINSQIDGSFYDDLACMFGIASHKLLDLLNIPASVQYRWRRTQRLSVDESDYALSQALVLREALGLFEGDKFETLEWLSRPNRALDHMAPISLLSTFAGIGIVEALIWKIENGVGI